MQRSLNEAGLPATIVTIEAGEQSKNMQVLSEVLEQIAESGLTRSDVLVTLGGGVVGDLGGFAAASFMRGIAFVQVPTSLLAQIDSSVGGKVAVDLKAGKNLAGAFYQPKGVFIDTNLLSTLPVRFLHDGLAEAIKYGCIQDANLFEKIAGYADDRELLADIGSVVATCCAIKARIVEEDEFDTGLRGILNFGHTLGHAVEQHYAYGEYTHGEGVAIGMKVYNYYHPEYTEIPRIIVDEVVTDTDSYYVNYYAVKDHTGEFGDLNAWSAQRWNALYTTTDKKAGDPIIASSLIVKLKDSEFPSEEHGAVHYFGETAAADVNRYQFKKTATATYIFYERDHSLSMTASTFSGGQIVMFTGCGLLGGIAIGSLGVIGAGKMKKKKEENCEKSETETRV